MLCVHLSHSVFTVISHLWHSEGRAGQRTCQYLSVGVIWRSFAGISVSSFKYLTAGLLCVVGWVSLLNSQINVPKYLLSSVLCYWAKQSKLWFVSVGFWRETESQVHSSWSWSPALWLDSSFEMFWWNTHKVNTHTVKSRPKLEGAQLFSAYLNWHHQDKSDLKRQKPLLDGY